MGKFQDYLNDQNARHEELTPSAPSRFEKYLAEHDQRRETHVQRRRAQRDRVTGNQGFSFAPGDVFNQHLPEAMAMAGADVFSLGIAKPVAGIEHGLGAKLSQVAADLGVDTENGEGLFDGIGRLLDLDTENDETFGEAFDRGYERRGRQSAEAYDKNPLAYEAGRLIPEFMGLGKAYSLAREPFEQAVSQVPTRAGRFATRVLGTAAGDVAAIAGSNALTGGMREGKSVFDDPEDALGRARAVVETPYVAAVRPALIAANRGGIAAKSALGQGEFRVTPDNIAASQMQHGQRSIADGSTGEAADQIVPLFSGDQVTQDSVKTFRFINNALRNVLKGSGLAAHDISARAAGVFNRTHQRLPSLADGRTTLAQLIERGFAEEFPEAGEEFAKQMRTFLLGVGLRDTGATARIIQSMREGQIDDYRTLIDDTFGTANPAVEEQTVTGEIQRLSHERAKALQSVNSQANQSPLANDLRAAVRESEDAAGIDFQARGYNSLEEFVEADPFTAANDLSVYLNDQLGRAAGDATAYTRIRRAHNQIEPLLAQVPNWRELTTDINQQLLVRDNLGYVDGFGQKHTGFGTDFRKAARDPDMPDRMVGHQVGVYEGTNPRQANALSRIENRQVQIDGQQYNARDLALKEQQHAARASLGETVRAPLNRSRSGGTNAEGQDIVGLNMSQMQREGDLNAIERLLGEPGQRFSQGVDNIVDGRRFAADIDPNTGSNTINKANAQASGDEFVSGLPRGLTGNVGPANITDAFLLSTGMPPINFLTRIAPQTVQRVFGPGRETRRKIANTLLQRPDAQESMSRMNALSELPQRTGRNQRRRGIDPSNPRLQNALAGYVGPGNTIQVATTVGGGVAGHMAPAENDQQRTVNALSGAMIGAGVPAGVNALRGRAANQPKLKNALADAEVTPPAQSGFVPAGMPTVQQTVEKLAYEQLKRNKGTAREGRIDIDEIADEMLMSNEQVSVHLNNARNRGENIPKQSSAGRRAANVERLIHLYEVDGLTIPQISERTGRSKNSIAAHLSRLRREGRIQRLDRKGTSEANRRAQGGLPDLNEAALSLGNRTLSVGQERMLPMKSKRRQQHAMREAGVKLKPGTRPIETAESPEKLAEAMEMAAMPIVKRDKEGFAYVERGPAGELMDEAGSAIRLRQHAAANLQQDKVRRYREGLRRIEADRAAAQGDMTATARARAEIHRLVRSVAGDDQTAQRLIKLHDTQFQQGRPLRASALPAPQLNRAEEALASSSRRQADDLAADMMAGRERQYMPSVNKQDPNFVRAMLDPRESEAAERIYSGRDLLDPKRVGQAQIAGYVAGGSGLLGGASIALSEWEPETDRDPSRMVPNDLLPSPVEPRGTDSVVTYQRLLRDSGFDPGPVDGIFGRQTAVAIAQAEASLGLPVTGQWSEELGLRLRSGSRMDISQQPKRVNALAGR